MDNSYLNTGGCSEQPFTSDFAIKQETFDGDNNEALLAWSQYINQSQQPDLMNGLSTDIDMYNLGDQNIWPQQPIDSTFESLFAPWNTTVNVPATIKEEWSLNTMPSYQQQLDAQSFNPVNNTSIFSNDFSRTFQAPPPAQFSRDITPPSSVSASGSNSPTSSVSTPPPSYYMPLQIPQFYHHPQPKAPQKNRRKSAIESHSTPTRTYRHRASSHPSVASVVSLTAHEPVARIIDGIEHITFLYSRDRLVKEYTVRTDVENVNLQDISSDFRAQNAIYPRANVTREEYDGNRWEYETSCNRLGWELCWLNQEQLCGRRGLIQRAVDSYRNRHAEMRSRRVTRQEKVANGTLRKRRVKKSNSAIL
ncbi:hypothetical protein BDF21DRAFT_413373 [Thamnidium elegans]|uniref:DUF8032 domain-containing protein n=1 Tax=Thamnidium elegans TaxID=101142 RepID=A0A8H7SZ30_9FUNG|nr:hypothetical protein INT48_002660 [Thamnidium elegans]KAI8088495.1 hypothetical protein BDF21DRAFT_413373 [Thamnidium elegans]